MKKNKLNLTKSFKLFYVIIGIIGFSGCVFSMTYAWYTWRSGNTAISGESGCFNVDYVSGSNISDTLLPTTSYNTLESKSTTIKMNMDPSCVSTTQNGSCSMLGTATIQLLTTQGSCSNDSYRTSSTCTANGGTWTGTDEIMLDGALKYSVYQGNIHISSGTITKTGENPYIHVLGTNISLTTTQVAYTIYLWLDQNVVSNEYIVTV